MNKKGKHNGRNVQYLLFYNGESRYGAQISRKKIRNAVGYASVHSGTSGLIQRPTTTA